MKSILYIGNKLNHKKSNLSSIGILGPLLENEGYTVYYASSKINKILRLLDMIFSCLKYCRKVDFVIIDTYSTLNFYYALCITQLCRLINVKYIPSLNGGDLPKRLQKNPKLSQLIFNHSYINISPSLYLKKAFEDAGYSNLRYIPNTINIENYQFKERDFKNIDLLWVRSFSNIYNPTLAVQVLKALQEDGLQVRLCMVGPDSDGSMMDVKKLAQELNVEVKLTGKLTKEAWRGLSNEYSIFINTTNFDNMPVSVIEAMALGLCVVTTNVGGLPFLISHGVDGLLVKPNSVNAFVNAIKKVSNFPVASKTMAFNARQKVEEFDWSFIKYKWFEVLQE